jgi:hypothetical protein
MFDFADIKLGMTTKGEQIRAYSVEQAIDSLRDSVDNTSELVIKRASMINYFILDREKEQN